MIGQFLRQPSSYSTPEERREEVRFTIKFYINFNRAEARTLLGKLYRYWWSFPKDGGDARMLDNIPSVMPEVEARLGIVDVSAQSPFDFYFLKDKPTRGRPNNSGLSLRHLDSEMDRTALLREFTMAKELRWPQYDEIHQDDNGFRISESRLLIPLHDEEAQVKYLIFLTRELDVVPFDITSLEFPLVLRRNTHF